MVEDLKQSFRDAGIQNDDTLVLREPPRARAESSEDEEEDWSEEQEEVQPGEEEELEQAEQEEERDPREEEKE